MTKPEQSNHCIWMDAELMDYQLCTLDYQCDDCPIQQKIVQPILYQTMEDSAFLPVNIRLPSPNEFRPGYQYYTNHIWIKRIGQSHVHVGIDNLFLRLWTNVKDLIPRKEGSRLSMHSSFCWIILESGIVNLQIPFAGTVKKINPFLHTEEYDYTLFVDLPMADRWIVSMEYEQESLNTASWLTKKEYISQIVQDTKWLMSFRKPAHKYKSPFHGFQDVPVKDVRKLVSLLSRNSHTLV